MPKKRTPPRATPLTNLFYKALGFIFDLLFGISSSCLRDQLHLLTRQLREKPDIRRESFEKFMNFRDGRTTNLWLFQGFVLQTSFSLMVASKDRVRLSLGSIVSCRWVKVAGASKRSECGIMPTA